MKWKSYTLVQRERESASLSLLFFQTPNCKWLCLPGKIKKCPNTGCTTMLLKVAADQEAFAYERCGSDAPANQRWILFHAQPTDASWVELEPYPASAWKCSDRLTCPLQLPLLPQTESKVFLKGWVRQEMAGPTFAWAGFNNGSTQL